MTTKTLTYSRANPTRRISILSLIVRALESRRQRRKLGTLDARALNDMGINPEAAARESARPVWDVPKYWLK